ncbi:MAG: flagellar hook-length control protein FliK, partial [Rhodoferax sp.]|nr:flagellar hook-length control protein FliK [Rhodoferax sp.]
AALQGAPALPAGQQSPGQGLRGEPASTGVRSTTSLAAPTVKPSEPSSSPNEAPLAADTPLTGPPTEPRPVPGSPTKADRSAPQADGAAVADALTPTAEAGTSAGQASASAHSMPGAATFSRNENWLTNPLSGATTSSPTGVGASITADSVTRSPRLTPEVGSQEWDKALGQQVVQMGKAGQQVTELQLNPPGLGPLKVTLEMNNHQMQVMFVSAHASVRAAVEAAVPQLRANLADSGISLGNTSVSSESQAQTAFAQHQNPAPRHQAYRNNSLPETLTAGAGALAGPRQRGAGLGVDTYA